MDPSKMDTKLFEEFMAFRAFKEAAEAKEKAQQEQDCEPSRGRSPTVGRESSPKDGYEEQRTAADEDSEKSPTAGRSLDPVDVDQDADLTPAPLPNSNKKKDKGKDRVEMPAQDDTTPAIDEDEQGERMSTPRAFRKQDERNKNALKAAKKSRKRDRSPSPQPGPSKRRRSQDPPVERKPVHPYDTCPTSYEIRPKKRGGRVKIIVNGREEIARTPMERLIHRKAKYKHVLKHGHLFGDKHGCYFNPYSKAPVNEFNCKRIPKPSGFQVGCGGPNALPWHWEIGLRDDYNLAMDVRGSARKALVKFRPKSRDLEPGTQLTWKDYGSKERIQINEYMYKRHKFLFHYRLKAKQDSWAIDAICSGYLASNSAYTKSGKNVKVKLYLKRNASGPGGQTDDEDDEADDDESEVSDDEGYEDDYNLNARRHAKHAPTSKSQPSTTKTATKKPTRKDNDSRSSKKQKVRAYGQEADDDSDSSSDSDSDSNSDKATLLPKPTSAEIRKADKQAAKEKIRDKAMGASRDKVGAKPLAAPKGKGKERKSSPVAPKTKGVKRKLVVVDDNDDDDEPTPLVSKQIRRTEATVSSSDEAEPAPKKAPKKNGTKTAPKSKAAPKRKELAPEADEEQPSWKPAKRPKPKPIPQPEEEDEEIEIELEVEDGGKGADQEEEEEELEPLPKLLVPEITRKLATEQKGGNGDGAAKSNRLNEKQAGTSKKLTTDATQLTTEELVQSGQARAVGTMAIKGKGKGKGKGPKAAIPPSDRSLRQR